MPENPKSFIGATVADRYVINGLLGEGGFAWVFRARDDFGATVAVKVLHSSNANALARFRREIEVLKALPENPHVPGYLDDGVTEGGQPFLVMEYIEGRNLVGAMREKRTFEPKEAVKIVVDLCQALVGLHQLGVAHRDLKPENVMLAQEGLIKLIDFGLVRDAQGILQLLEQESTHEQDPVFSMDIDRLKVAGTPEYMAPEQFSDAFETKGGRPRTDTWSDVFSLGVILFELISTNVPFPIEHSGAKGDFNAKLVRYIRWRLKLSDKAIPKCKAMDRALESIVHKALRKDPRQRQVNAEMLKNDLQQYLRTGRGVSRSYGAHTVDMQLETGEFPSAIASLSPPEEASTPSGATPSEVELGATTRDGIHTPVAIENERPSVEASSAGENDCHVIERPIIVISDRDTTDEHRSLSSSERFKSSDTLETDDSDRQTWHDPLSLDGVEHASSEADDTEPKA